jgi:MoaA/NifB/PqqE/SkfB family radical SAM enzyme
MRVLDSHCCFSHYPSERRLVWELTEKCNLLCVHCLITRIPNNERVLLYKDILKIIRRVIKGNFNEVLITGGEPFCAPFLKRVITELVTHGITVDVVSNGTLIKEEWVKPFCGLVERFSISLYGPTDTVHEAVTRKKGSFQRSVSAIKMLVGYNARVNIIFSLMKTNYRFLSETVMLAFKLGVNEFCVTKPFGGLPSLLYAINDLNTLRSVFREIEGLREQGYIVRTTGWSALATEVCPGGRSIFGLDAGGFLHTCLQNRARQESSNDCLLSDMETVITNLRNTTHIATRLCEIKR